jgi:hypothetical protein
MMVLLGDGRIAAEGRRLALARIRADIAIAREEALEEAP